MLCAFFPVSMVTMAETLPFDLSLTGRQFDVHKALALSDLGEGRTEIGFDFKDKAGRAYSFDLRYKPLPGNRSFPGNLDISVKDAQGNKRGYLFFAINEVAFLKRMGTFGLVVDVDGAPLDIRFVFDPDKRGELRVATLGDERFVQDVLVPKFDFQMIRPVVLASPRAGLRTQRFALDTHPYAVSYTLQDRERGVVEFRYELSRVNVGDAQLLARIYFQADSLATLREAMFAGKYFDPADGPFKLVFYPAMGQTEPVK